MKHLRTKIIKKPQETLNFKLTQLRETFLSTITNILGLHSFWKIELTSLEICNSFFNKVEENIKFEFNTDLFVELSFTKFEVELEDVLDISNFALEHLQDKRIGPRLFQPYRKLTSIKRQTDGCILLLLGYARSLFRDLESFFRIVVGDKANELVSKQDFSNVVTY